MLIQFIKSRQTRIELVTRPGLTTQTNCRQRLLRGKIWATDRPRPPGRQRPIRKARPRARPVVAGATRLPRMVEGANHPLLPSGALTSSAAKARSSGMVRGQTARGRSCTSSFSRPTTETLSPLPVQRQATLDRFALQHTPYNESSFIGWKILATVNYSTNPIFSTKVNTGNRIDWNCMSLQLLRYTFIALHLTLTKKNHDHMLPNAVTRSDPYFELTHPS